MFSITCVALSLLTKAVMSVGPLMDSQLSLPVIQEITGLTPPMHVTWLVNDPMRKPFLSFREFVELQRGGGKSRDKCENFGREPHGLQKSQGGIS